MSKRTILAWTNVVAALAVSIVLLLAAGRSVLGLPALAAVFDPVRGIWTDLPSAKAESADRTLAINQLERPVRITFEANGTPHVQAQSDHDAWVALGYLHASFRLHQMDLMRRQGSGRLAEVAGRSAVKSDTFQRQLGLSRHAEAAWASLPPDSELRGILQAYADGVNQVIADDTRSGRLPALFKLMGYAPEPWKPQDTLLLTDVLTQMMGFSKLPLYYSIWSDTLGYERTMELMPLLPPNEQRPFASSAQPGAQTSGTSGGTVATSAPDGQRLASNLKLLDTLESLPSLAVHDNPSSNGWAVAGSKSATGKPLLAGDPHLDYSMPSIWFEVHVDSPGFSFGGASVPGVPAVLVGQSRTASWTMTSGQNQQTFYYEEKTDPGKPGQYEWNGQWKPFDEREETIRIKGGGSETVTVRSTVHGPVITQEGLTLAVDWLGALPGVNLQSFVDMLHVRSFAEFKEALRPLTAPVMNFLYADTSDIGVVTAGKIPTFPPEAKPWMPMPGSGGSERTGWVPFDEQPQSMNPPGGVIGSANQRQIGASYPYYLGTSAYFDPGFRARRMYEQLTAADKVDSSLVRQMQHESYDPLAAELVPKLLQALDGEPLNDAEHSAIGSLRSWNFKAAADSSAASVWWLFWEHYLKATFEPWWSSAKVPADEHPGLAIGPTKPALVMDLEAWTLNDPDNPYFSDPQTGRRREARDVMRLAFHQAVQELAGQLGSEPRDWAWSKLHTRFFPALTGIASLQFGPKGSGGDLYSLDSVGVRKAAHGPTWRMIVDWGSGRTEAAYPGGQSGNPASPWYLNRMTTWWDGGYDAFIDFDQAAAGGGTMWRLTPAEP